MVRKLLVAGVLAGLAATAAPASARPIWRTCEDWEDIFCYSWRHEMFCWVYAAELCINPPQLPGGVT